jgi:uncharacterized oxidoreductase
MKVVNAGKLVDFVATIMQGAGCPPVEAATVARRLVDSNLDGHDSHGVLRVAKYLEWVRDGTLKPNTSPTIVFESDTIAIIDGHRGFGQVIGEFAARTGIAKAAQKGIAMIGLTNCGHLGRVGDWADMAATQGRYRCISSTRRARCAPRPSAEPTDDSRRIPSRSACPSRTAIRWSSTSPHRWSPRAS